MAMMKRLILPALLFASFATAVTAGQPVTLKRETADADGLVTLGDLFDGAGSASDVPVARRSGLTVVLDAGAYLSPSSGTLSRGIGGRFSSRRTSSTVIQPSLIALP